MAKNELLPFANGADANVLPTNQWEALTDILENGFQSGIAKSEQVNRVLSQGAIASYVLGQLIVDELNQDATLDKNTLYQRLVSALESKAKDVCLPLSGGSMTGRIIFDTIEEVIRKSNTDTRTIIRGGDGFEGGGSLYLYGKDYQELRGGFRIYAHDGTASKSLSASPDGTFKWDGKNVVCVDSWRNGTQWYRKYSDGWIEQGGVVTNTYDGAYFEWVNLPVSFTTTDYTILGTNISNYEGANSSSHAYVMEKSAVIYPSSKSTASFRLFFQTKGYSSYWYACGY